VLHRSVPCCTEVYRAAQKCTVLHRSLLSLVCSDKQAGYGDKHTGCEDLHPDYADTHNGYNESILAMLIHVLFLLTRTLVMLICIMVMANKLKILIWVCSVPVSW